MVAIKVHAAVYSNNARRVFAALYEKDLDFELVPVDMKSGGHKMEPVISLNPFGQIPAFEHGEHKLFESRAITKYIAQEFADRGTQLACHGKASASFLVWTEVEAHQFDGPASKLNWEIVFKPMFGLTTDPAAVEENEVKLVKVLDVYEARLSKSKYLAGDSFTLVDLHHLPALNTLMSTHLKNKLFDARPHVSAWVADISSRPAWVKVLAMSKHQ